MNDPQAPAGAQLQVTPLDAGSFVTVAATLAVAPSATVVGALEIATAIAGGGVPPPEEPPLLQPEIDTKASVARMSGFLITVFLLNFLRILGWPTGLLLP